MAFQHFNKNVLISISFLNKYYICIKHNETLNIFLDFYLFQ